MNILKKIHLKSKTTYKIDNYLLKIPKGHSLPYFQYKYPLYDRFLPLLIKNLNIEGDIIDIGANIGDSILSSINNCNNKFICIEGSDYFTNFLKHNLKGLKQSDINRVKIIKALVGTSAIKGSLEINSNRTAHIEESISNIATHQPLDNLINSDKIALIKSDTDGYDWDVLLSAKSIIEKHSPILFWENEVIKQNHIEEYYKLYEHLSSNGYDKVVLFDNFGSILLEDVDISVLNKIAYYILRMNQKKFVRTFFYVDVLAYQTKHKTIVENALSEFKTNFSLGF